MKKPFLLIAGDNYYPQGGTGDWIACFETFEDAKNQVSSFDFRKSKEYKGMGKFLIKTRDYSFDWYEIIDLRQWAEE